jgi:hypothetical protein
VVYGCQVFEYLRKMVVPARDTRKDKIQAKNPMDKQVKLVVPICSSQQNIYQQVK